MLDMVVGLVTSPWIYLVLMLMIMADVLLPVLPSGTLLITASVYAVNGENSLVGLVAVAVIGSLVGDVVGYLIGQHAGARVLTRFSTQSRRERMAVMLAKHGGPLTVLARFVPAGRTVAALSAATVGVPARRYVVWSTLAAMAWGGYGVALGYVNGELLGTSWLSVGVAVIAATVGGFILASAWRHEEKKTLVAEQAVEPVTAVAA